MTSWRLTLTVLADEFAICRLPPDTPIPAWADSLPFTAITRTAEELSITCARAAAPADVQAQLGWRCLKVEGPFDLNTTIGVLAALAQPLAQAGVSLYVVSTFDTDYLFVRGEQLGRTMETLSAKGHSIQPA
jgi:hypothetical protein